MSASHHPAPLLIAGLINIETTLRVDGFPIPYFPVCYPFGGVKSTVSGVGYNLAKALHILGREVRFASLVGDDLQGQLVRATLERDALPQAHVLAALAQTPQSVILYDATGRREIHVDLKDAQERTYPAAPFYQALEGCAAAALCNINFTRAYLWEVKRRGIPVATDVHTLGDLNDAYNRDYMAAADILFMSNEHLPTAPEAWARQVLAQYGPQVLVIGMGAQGALLATRTPREMWRVPAVAVRPVVNTIGAGDALFASFLHGYLLSGNPLAALKRAVVFAAYKIGVTGAAEGFLNATELDQWCAQIDPKEQRCN